MSTITSGTTFEQPRLQLSKHARGAYQAMIALDGAVELDSSLRDLVSLRASILNGCAYCIDMHTLDAAHRGESEQRLRAVSAWHEAPLFSERERAALALTDAITLIADTHVPRHIYDAAPEHFDEEELLPAAVGDHRNQRLEPARDRKPDAPRRIPARPERIEPWHPRVNEPQHPKT